MSQVHGDREMIAREMIAHAGRDDHRRDAIETLFSRRCTVRFEPSGKTSEVESGTLLLDAAREAGLPVAQSCGGFAICSWCRMQVLDGAENLSSIEPPEARLIRRERFAPNERASCQAEIHGDVVVTTTYW